MPGHPGGDADLNIAIGVIKELIDGIRMLYTAGSQKGSSGGPTTIDGKVCGIHYLGTKKINKAYVMKHFVPVL